VYGALLAVGTDLESRGIAIMIRAVRENTVRRCMRVLEAELGRYTNECDANNRQENQSAHVWADYRPCDSRPESTCLAS